MEWTNDDGPRLVPTELATFFEAMGFERLGRLSSAPPAQLLTDVYGASSESTWAEINFADESAFLEFTTVLDDARIVVTVRALEAGGDPPGQVTQCAGPSESVEALWALHRSNLERTGAAARPRAQRATREEFLDVQTFRATRRARVDASMTRWALMLAASVLVCGFLAFSLAIDGLTMLGRRFNLSLPWLIGLAIAVLLGLFVLARIALGDWVSQRIRARIISRLDDPPRAPPPWA